MQGIFFGVSKEKMLQFMFFIAYSRIGIDLNLIGTKIGPILGKKSKLKRPPLERTGFQFLKSK
jgi:hypothetical protein